MAPGVVRKRVLLAICVVAAFAMIAEFIFAQSAATNGTLPIWKLELLLLPWVLFVGCYVSIVFTSWFDDEHAPLMRKALSTLGAAAVTGLVTLIYFAIMFR
jgi:hypothetical protein